MLQCSIRPPIRLPTAPSRTADVRCDAEAGCRVRRRGRRMRPGCDTGSRVARSAEGHLDEVRQRTRKTARIRHRTGWPGADRARCPCGNRHRQVRVDPRDRCRACGFDSRPAADRSFQARTEGKMAHGRFPRASFERHATDVRREPQGMHPGPGLIQGLRMVALSIAPFSLSRHGGMAIYCCRSNQKAVSGRDRNPRLRCRRGALRCSSPRWHWAPQTTRLVQRPAIRARTEWLFSWREP